MEIEQWFDESNAKQLQDFIRKTDPRITLSHPEQTLPARISDYIFHSHKKGNRFVGILLDAKHFKKWHPDRPYALHFSNQSQHQWKTPDDALFIKK